MLPPRSASFILFFLWVFVCPSLQVIPSCIEGEVPMVPALNSSAKVHFYFMSVLGLHGLGSSPDNCGAIQQSGLQLAEAFMWYLKKNGLNTSDISSGGIVVDSCFDKLMVIQKVLGFETKQTSCSLKAGKKVEPSSVFVYIGSDDLPNTVALSQALGRTNKTLISSFLNTDAAISYPYFLQTAPENTGMDEVLLDLLVSNGVKYLLVARQNVKTWADRSETFSSKAKAVKICTVHSAPLPDVSEVDAAFDQTVSKLLQKKVVKYLVVMAENPTTLKLLEAIGRNAEARNNLAVITFGFLDIKRSDIKYLTIIPSLPAGDILTDASQFFNDYIKNLKDTKRTPWKDEFCQNQECNNPSYKLDPRVPFLFLTLKASLEAVKNCGGTLCTSDKNSWAQDVWKFTKNVQLNIDGKKQSVFSPKGFINPLIIKYKLKIKGQESLLDYTKGKELDFLKYASSCPNKPCTECGEALPTTTEKLQVSTVPTLAPTTQKHSKKYVSIPKVDSLTGVFGPVPVRRDSEYGLRDAKWIIPLGVLASLGVLAVIIFEITILYKLLGTQLGHQWRTMWLGQLLLFGVLLCFLTLFAYMPKPTDETCGITRFGVGFSYALVFSVMLVKLMVILTSKANDGLLLANTESPNYLRGTYQILLFIFALGVQIVIDVQWLLTVPPKAVPVTDLTGNTVWICNHYTWSTAAGPEVMLHFIRNNFENHLLTLVYVMFLILVTTLVSMKAHGIITNHRESVFIGISAGLSIPLWIAWALIAGLNRTSPHVHQYGDACIAFGLFLTGALVLFAMFLPKVRQMVNMGLEGVYLEDDRDTTYNGSVIMPPPSYKSGYRGSGSVLYINGGTIYNESIKDPMALHLKHPGSTYSAPTYIKSNRPESLYGTSRILKVTPDLTGRTFNERRRTQSEHNYPVGSFIKPRSEKGSTLTRSRSTHDLGSL